MTGFSLRLPENLESRLDEEARRDRVTRSEIARTAIAEFLERKESLALAEEAVRLDNE